MDKKKRPDSKLKWRALKEIIFISTVPGSQQ